MTGGHECLVCHERVRPFGQGCACGTEPYRTCPCCGREWSDVDHMRATTDPIGWTQIDDDEMAEWVNCDCGSTLVVSVRRVTVDDCPPTLRATGE